MRNSEKMLHIIDTAPKKRKKTEWKEIDIVFIQMRLENKIRQQMVTWDTWKKKV